MLFKNLNNFTLEERVLYLQNKTKEITEWINEHGGNSEDIHKMIEEQIQKIISDNNLSNEEILQRLNGVDDELSTLSAQISEIDRAYKAADESIKNSFNSQIEGLRTESQTYANNAANNALIEAKKYTDENSGGGSGSTRYAHLIYISVIGLRYTEIYFTLYLNTSAQITTLTQLTSLDSLENVGVSGVINTGSTTIGFGVPIKITNRNPNLEVRYIDSFTAEQKTLEIQSGSNSVSVYDRVIKL